jgi:hypothetical protein
MVTEIISKWAFEDGNIIAQGTASSGCIVLHKDVSSESVHQPSSLSDLSGDNTSMHVDVDRVESELNAYTRVQPVPLEHVQVFPRLDQTVPATSASPERLFSSVGLVESDLWGNLLDTTLIDVIWAKPAP